ncbi:ABC transporter ATP-binding protein [Pseudochelatococcus contaminans]|uniref:Peptide/nickel transport system ATP-binding protein n=1 Tax=Pseudochelatococcus contaminans TaxID=1538103 RepID=A0A7W5Z4G0_9HYPH|nr:ABC transporter ATP-binding protein [Pseudochelatococcus contaminans]MBB3809922.1 peptide/nickel transport system ATP-binding protein [Pseudochelatococcus contaminans]
MNDAPLLDIRALSITARSASGPIRLIDDVSLTLARGQVLGLIGESGAGKSTIGFAALGYLRPGLQVTGGEVRIDGRDILALSAQDRSRLRGARLAYVAQSATAAFNPAHRLGDQVVEAALAFNRLDRSKAKKRARDLFAMLELPSPNTFGERFPHQVSGGQLQRAMIAMAMCTDPELIVFDEPTTALDVTTQDEVLKAIRNVIAASGAGALYISHDLAVVARVADEILVLRHGRAVEHGATRAVIDTPREAYTKALLDVARRGGSRSPEAGSTPSLLSIEGITAAYRHGGTILHDVSLSLPEARTLAVVGESGSGKSTLGRVVNGLLPPQAGTVSFQGRTLAASLDKRSRNDRREIQTIHQSPDAALNPRQTVGSILVRPLGFYFGMTGKRKQARINELLTQVELDPALAKRYPAELSGGQKQRVCIARALAAEPRLIICDEPTSALDPLVADGILRLLRELQESRGLSYLFITHDIATVRAFAHEVAVMHLGRVVRQGTVAKALSPPFDDYTGRLLAAVPTLDNVS